VRAPSTRSAPTHTHTSPARRPEAQTRPPSHPRRPARHRYAWGDLAGHEWGKHGGCSAWSSPASDQQAYWAVQAEALANITAGLGSTLVHQSVGGNSSFVALEQAFRQDVGGAKPLLSCNGMCELTQVWLGFSAEPTTLRPQVEPRFGRDARGSAAPTDCATCDDVHVPAWSGCPPAPPPPSPNPP